MHQLMNFHNHWSMIFINIWSASYSSFSENKILSFSKCRGRHPRTWSCEFELVSRVELLHPSSAAQQTHDMLSGALLQVDWSSGNWILCSELVRIEVDFFLLFRQHADTETSWLNKFVYKVIDHLHTFFYFLKNVFLVDLEIFFPIFLNLRSTSWDRPGSWKDHLWWGRVQPSAQHFW